MPCGVEGVNGKKRKVVYGPRLDNVFLNALTPTKLLDRTDVNMNGYTDPFSGITASEVLMDCQKNYFRSLS